MKLENAKVTITVEDPNEILEAMQPDDKMDFLQALSCHDEIIEYVMQQVFTGWTEGGFHGSMVCDWNGSSILQQFQRKLIEIGADDMAKKRIEELERYMKRSDEREAELQRINSEREDCLRGY
ncbi:MAG: hypothetical protein KTR16_11570 [Acidiferrobacterales bacterium]|nr:hypothetical protein [Acidiferrobacterales bacterium]